MLTDDAFNGVERLPRKYIFTLHFSILFTGNTEHSPYSIFVILDVVRLSYVHFSTNKSNTVSLINNYSPSGAPIH